MISIEVMQSKKPTFVDNETKNMIKRGENYIRVKIVAKCFDQDPKILTFVENVTNKLMYHIQRYWILRDKVI